MKFKYYVPPVILGAVLLGSAANACSPTTLAYLQGKQATMLVSPNGRYLLRNIPGMGATELVHIGQAVMAHKGGLSFFLDNTFNYPTLAEAYKISALDAWNRMPH